MREGIWTVFYFLNTSDYGKGREGQRSSSIDMEREKLGIWTKSWAPSLWKGWVASAIFVIGVVLTLLEVLRDTSFSKVILVLLRNNHPWPLWLILLASVLIIFRISAGFVCLWQVWDDWRIPEAELQLKIFAGEKLIIEGKKLEMEKELQTMALLLQNVKGCYEEKLRRLDVITGVPDYLAYSADLMERTNSGRKDNLSLILIDIDKIKWLNERNRECADLVMRYFAQSTMNSMRRDEQIHKSTTKMYGIYQGGDEFFFVISGGVFDAIGFANWLGDRVRFYQSEIREAILSRYLVEKDVNSFHLSFSGAIIDPEKLSLQDAYEVLELAKRSAKSRLLVIFDSSYEEPFTLREKLEKTRDNVRRNLIELQLKAESGDEESKEMHEALLNEESKFDANINVLKKAEQIFSV
jgi:GGDEF domain-containing protein